jgi:hypothetical protein
MRWPWPDCQAGVSTIHGTARLPSWSAKKMPRRVLRTQRSLYEKIRYCFIRKSGLIPSAVISQSIRIGGLNRRYNKFPIERASGRITRYLRYRFGLKFGTKVRLCSAEAHCVYSPSAPPLLPRTRSTASGAARPVIPACSSCSPAPVHAARRFYVCSFCAAESSSFTQTGNDRL